MTDTWALGVPYGETVDGWFFQSYARLLSWVGQRIGSDEPSRYSQTISVRGGPNLSYIRGQIAEEFLHTDCRWLAMCDADQGFEPNVWDQMAALMEERDLEVLAGVTCVVGTPDGSGAHLNVYRRDEATGYYIPLDEMPPPKTLMKVGAVGGACVMVDREVFHKTAPHWFHHVTRPDGDQFSEDISFFGERCREAGVDVYAHSDCVFTHAKTLELDPRQMLPTALVASSEPEMPDLRALKSVK